MGGGPNPRASRGRQSRTLPSAVHPRGKGTAPRRPPAAPRGADSPARWACPRGRHRTVVPAPGCLQPQPPLRRPSTRPDHQGPCDLLAQPASPVLTPRHRRWAGSSFRWSTTASRQPPRWSKQGPRARTPQRTLLPHLPPRGRGPLLRPHALKTTQPLPTPRPSRQSGLRTGQWAWTLTGQRLTPCSPQKVLELDAACTSPAFPSGGSLPKRSRRSPSPSSPTSRLSPFPVAPTCGPRAEATFFSRRARVCPLVPTRLHGDRRQGATVSCLERAVHAAPSCDRARV